MDFRTRRRDQNQGIELNVIPLIDVLLVILIFFITSATFDKTNHLQLELPEASGQAKVLAEQQQSLEVAVNAKGEFFVNGKALINQELATLRKAIQQESGKAKLPRFVLSADEKAPYQAIVNVMDTAGQLGFVNLSIATRSQDNAPKP